MIYSSRREIKNRNRKLIHPTRAYGRVYRTGCYVLAAQNLVYRAVLFACNSPYQNLQVRYGPWIFCCVLIITCVRLLLSIRLNLIVIINSVTKLIVNHSTPNILFREK